MTSEHEGSVENERPPFLYHGSSNRELKAIHPRAQSVRDPNEGPIVFATPDRAGAVQFMMNSDDSWCQLSKHNDVRVAVYADRTKFEQLDQGGTVYTLPSEGFAVQQPVKHPDEWTHSGAVAPIERTDYPSVLEAMLDSGIQVYFTDYATLKRIQAAPDHGVSIIRGLESENMKMGREVRVLPESEDESQ